MNVPIYGFSVPPLGTQEASLKYSSGLEGPAKSLFQICSDLICNPEVPALADNGMFTFLRRIPLGLFQSSLCRPGYQGQVKDTRTGVREPNGSWETWVVVIFRIWDPVSVAWGELALSPLTFLAALIGKGLICDGSKGYLHTTPFCLGPVRALEPNELCPKSS